VTFVVQMLSHTPPYVFVLLAYLVWQGLLSLRTRRRAVWRMLIVPGLLWPRACYCSSSGQLEEPCPSWHGSLAWQPSFRWDL